MQQVAVHPPYLDMGLRWTARITGMFVLATFVLYWMRESSGSLFTHTETLSLIALFASAVGLVLAWGNELLGGTMNVAGMMAFYLIHFAATGRIPDGIMYLPMIVPGVLYLACWWRSR